MKNLPPFRPHGADLEIVYPRAAHHAERFHHRENSDGTFDSICLRCFLTVGSAESEEFLLVPETQHICRPSDLLRDVETSEQPPPGPSN